MTNGRKDEGRGVGGYKEEGGGKSERGAPGEYSKKQTSPALTSSFLRSVRRGDPPPSLAKMRKWTKKDSGKGTSDKENLRQFIKTDKSFGEIHSPRPLAFQGGLYLRFATVFIDVAFIGRKSKNDGFIGFVTAVEGISTQLAAVPIKRRTITAFESAIKTLLRETMLSQVVLIIADRESALFSKKFSDFLKKKYGVAIKYLSKRNKSYLAERYNKMLKTRLSRGMRQTKSERWVDLLQPIIRQFNRQYVKGTSFRRKNISAKNVQQFLDEKYKTEDFPSLLNSVKIHSSTILNQKWKKKIFLFEEGERVLLSRAVSGGRGGEGRFPKPSLRGYFDEKVYVITDRFLATTRDLSLIAGLSCLILMMELRSTPDEVVFVVKIRIFARVHSCQ